MSKVEEGAYYEHQLPGETAHQFQAFATYRDLGITRSLKKAAQLFYSDGSPGYPEDTEGIPETGGGARLSRFKAWSREHSWIARVEAFDLEETRKRSLLMQQRREEMVEDHLSLAKLGMNVAAKKLYDIMRQEDTLPSGVLPQLVTAITTLQRLTLGEATARLETSEADPDERIPDFSVLTDEEVTLMDDAYRKLYGSLD